MISLDVLRQLRDAYSPYTPIMPEDVLAENGNPTPEALVAAALQGMSSDDRNVRVLMLRILAAQSGEAAMRGVLAGLNDKKRRVRRVAIRACHNYLDFPEITERLKAMVTDENEKRKIREAALTALAGIAVHPIDTLTETAAEVLKDLTAAEQYRSQILFGLVRLDLTEEVETLLRDFVKQGSKDEAVMATRALCGYRVIHIDIFLDCPAIRKHVIQTCELAAGRMFYWIDRDEFADLREQCDQTA